MRKINLLILASSCICLFAAGCGDDGKPVFVDQAAADNTICAPTSILNVETAKQFNNLAYNSDSVLLTINENGKIVSSKNEEIGDFVNYYSNLNKERYPICVRIESDEVGNKFTDIVKNGLGGKHDFTVVSKSDSVIKNIRTIIPELRAALDVSAVENMNYDDSRCLANTIGANVLIINQSQISTKDIRRTQNLSKTVWVIAEGSSRADNYTLFASQAGGVILNDINAYNSDLNRFSYYKDPVLARPQFNIAHRGDGHNYAENSIESCEAAIKGGAEALELDFRLTSDKRIVVMHDATTDKVTNGSLTIADSTLAQLKELDIIRGFGGEEVEPCKIPTFEEVCELLKKYPDVILYAEIKSKLPDFPEIFCNLAKEYGIAKRMVVINFESLLGSVYPYEKCREYLPEIWGLDLIWSPITAESSLDFKVSRCMGFDCNLLTGSLLEGQYGKYMLDRGYLPTYWTLTDYPGDTGTNMKNGIYAMTNNYPVEYKDYPKEFAITEEITTTDPRDSYACQVTTYSGSKIDTYATVVAADNNNVVFYCYETTKSDNFTHLFSISK